MGFRAPRLTASSANFFPPIQKNMTAAISAPERADVYRNDIHPHRTRWPNAQRDRAAENVNDRRCRNALELKLLLQKRNRRFVEIYYRAYAGKADAYEEHYADYPSAGHAVNNIYEEDEHKSGAAGVELSAAGRHGRDDDKRRKQRRERIRISQHCAPTRGCTPRG